MTLGRILYYVVCAAALGVLLAHVAALIILHCVFESFLGFIK